MCNIFSLNAFVNSLQIFVTIIMVTGDSFTLVRAVVDPEHWAGINPG